MKKIACEMCGGTDLIKQDGVFVCQNCGMKYSVEEAKKMMIEGTVNVTGTVQVDSSAHIKNYLDLAMSALANENNAEAEQYANKIIEIDPCNSKAWEIKGTAAGWQSTARNNRLDETIALWNKAIEYASPEEKADVVKRVNEEFLKVNMAAIQLFSKHFTSLPSDENYRDIMYAIDKFIKNMNIYTVSQKMVFNRAGINNQIARALNSSAVGAVEELKKRHGSNPATMYRAAWQSFEPGIYNAKKLFNVALEFVRDEKLEKTIYENLQETSRLLASAKRENLDANSIMRCFARKSDVEYYSKKIFECQGKAEKVLSSVQGKRKAEGMELAKKKYWEEHQAEYEALLSEKTSLQKENSELENGMNQTPSQLEIKETNRKINELTSTMNGLGLFKGKEKKKIQGEISELYDVVSSLKEKAMKEKQEIQSKVAKNKGRIKEIDSEFAKERGCIEEESQIAMAGAFSEGKFAITLNQFIEQIKKHAPLTFSYSTKCKESSFESLGEEWCISFETTDDNGEVSYPHVDIGVYAASEDSPITAFTLEGLMHEEYCPLWIKIGEFLIRSLDGTISKDKAERIILDQMYSGNDSNVTVNDLSIGFWNKFNEYGHDYKGAYAGAYGGTPSCSPYIWFMPKKH